MELDTGLTGSIRATLDTSPVSASSSPSLSEPSDARTDTLPHLPTPRRSPPRLNLHAISPSSTAIQDESFGPALRIQPASPALPKSAAPSLHSTSPDPIPIPSTSSISPPTVADTLAFQPLPSPSTTAAGGLAARRAARLGKKRLSLVVPPNPHSSLPTASGAPTQLLSPLTPSYLRPSDNLDAETRSLPPSPVSLTTFIGPEGSEAPDRTIGRLMFKQQADEMREQMRGGRGMKRRTSIPRLNLVKGGAATAQPANLDNLAPPTSEAGTASSVSAVQLIRASGTEREGNDEALEEFPYAFGPREILPGVFLGSEQNAKDPAVLRDWRIGFVLNVAKEVECPWTAESSDEEVDLQAEQIEKLCLDELQDATPVTQAVPRPSPPRPSKTKHRRTKTQVVVSSVVTPTPPTGSSPPRVPLRPAFVRPTASTPNLHASFQPLSPPLVPPIPSPVVSPKPIQAPEAAASQRSLSTSPPHSRRPTPRLQPTQVHARPQTTTRSADAVRFPPNPRSGRPELEYLWLKWGHDEADLVEAQKFQAAFDFLDEARERGERTLVHCQCGVSRSATVVIAYCMREAAKALEEGRDPQELAGCTGMHDTCAFEYLHRLLVSTDGLPRADSFVKEKSEWVGPNLSLVFQLVAYERTLRGDSGTGDDLYAASAYPLEPSKEEDQGLPPPTPADSFRPFAFPLPFHHQPSFPSPRTPMSESSMADSQLSTPDLHDPLISPTFTNATPASSVTSTPLSIDRVLPPSVRIVRGDDGAEHGGRYRQNGIRDRHSSLETVVAEQDEGEQHSEDKVERKAFVLSVPPNSAYTPPQYQELASPTVAVHPHQQRPRSDTIAQSATLPPRSSFLRQSGAPSSTLTGLPPLAMPRPTSGDATSLGRSPASLSPPRQSSRTTLTSPLSAVSTTSSTTSISSGGLSRTNAGRRFGAGQTPSERKASHRRVCSDTIRVPSPLLFTPAGTTGHGASPLSVSTPELESSPVRARLGDDEDGA